MLLVWTTGLGYVPQFISPPLAFLLFILRAKGNGQPFDSLRAFTSLSLLLILAQSLSQALLDLPPLLPSFGSSSRIDKFLSTESRVDIWYFPTLLDELQDTDFEKKYAPRQIIIKGTNGFFGWKDDRDILHDINITIPRGRSIFIVGPIASGKSTLCHALLGETPRSRGNVEIFADAKYIGFCRQTPHLTNRTVQQNIIGFSPFQPGWYNTVIKACAPDIDSLPHGNETIVGSDGINLSVDLIILGQAIYIFREVIGPNGLAQQKGITVIIATHATEYLSPADHIIALDKSGHVTQQGNFQSLRSQSGYISSLTIAENFRKETVVQTDQGAAKGISALLLLLGVAYHTLIRFVSRAGSSLHEDILDVVINATLSFFGSTDIGVTINRFSQDIHELPMALLNWLLTVFLALGQVILIIIASPWVGFAFIAIVPVLYMMQNFYLRTSRQPRLLELEATSPLYSNFLENLNGLSTLRAFGWTAQALETNYRLLDESQKLIYLLYMIQRWLTFVLDVTVAFLAAIILALAVTLTQGERMDRSRDKHRTSAPHRSRPESPALSDLTITIEEGQKAGICGRSGSGKSFLLLLLLRLLEVQGGSITVDGLELASLPRNLARSRFNMIPQEPVFIPGTVQFNLDPDSQYSDYDLITALKKVLLFDVISAQGGVNSEFQPSSLSHGQRQLFCLAGAILRKSRIGLLDEITSNVEQATDELMQKIVREEFKLCTIIAIAHRLNTIMDFDRVIVLDGGHIVESGKPQDLLLRDSMFKQMWKGNTKDAN
ncbi:canalicular multispecific organic anion transporter [Trichophyton mentagrophytes]|nr:canalicular multispecific organic anion transporter [Trichophyton mentagrophytes]